MYIRLFLLSISLLCFGTISFAEAKPVAVLLDLTGPVGPATSDYVGKGLNKARQQGAALVILRIDTPGGLSSSMREIIQDILASPVPVVSYVAPSGARAASAGTYILYASHVAAMAPGTNLGAATPVQIGGGSVPLPGATPDKDKEKKQTTKPVATMKDKMVNDAVAYIRSLAQMRGRNAQWAEKAVREAASLSANDALKKGVIELMAGDLDELLAKLDGRIVTVLGKQQSLATANMPIHIEQPDWRTKLLSIITNPNVAYILMLIGIYGLFLEFYSPGTMIPGTIGAISLLVALYALNMLPVNYAGVALLVLGLALMIAETFVPSFGILGLGGVAAFVIGSVMLLDTQVPGFEISRTLIGSIALVSAGLFTLVMSLLVRAMGQPVVSGLEEIQEAKGYVLDWDGLTGRVRVHGEIWAARSKKPLQPGASVRVNEVEGLTLVVSPNP